MDQILYWNEVALEANRISFTDQEKGEQGGPTLSSRALGIVHIAMHDAYMKVSGSVIYTPYLPMLDAPVAGASADAAIAGAAYTALSALYPKQKSFFDKKLNSISVSASGKEAGHRYGVYIAKKILDQRKDDPKNDDTGYAPPSGRGMHKLDPYNTSQGYLAPFYGAQSKLFAATQRHELNKPPIDNPEYEQSLRQVKGKGIAPELMGTLPPAAVKRTAEESLIGLFWAYDGTNEIGTPPRFYNQIIRSLAIKKGNKVEANARLFALVNVAMADAGILAWDQKYIHNFWRPVNGIREHDKSMGATGVENTGFSADCDPQWLPLGSPKSNVAGSKNFTPGFPAYPSGHATFGAAAFHIARLFYNKNLSGDRSNDTLLDDIQIVSDELNGVTRDNNGTVRPCHLRSFDGGLWKMIVENALSRIYLGVHWSFDAFKVDSDGNPIFGEKTGGVDLGVTIAEDIFKSCMKKSIVGPRA